MTGLEAFQHHLARWLGLHNVPDLAGAPLELVLQEGPALWLAIDDDPKTVVLSSVVPKQRRLSLDEQIFLLRQNDPAVNRAGMAIGADAESGVVTVARRFDVTALDHDTFEASVLALCQMAHGMEAACDARDAAPIHEVLSEWTSKVGSAHSDAVETLIETLKMSDFALQSVRRGVATLPLANCAIVVEAACRELCINVTASFPVDDAKQPSRVGEMLLRNMFLAKCRSGGFYVDGANQPGAYGLFVPTHDPKKAFGAAAAAALGDLMLLPGLENIDNDRSMPLPWDTVLIKA